MQKSLFSTFKICPTLQGKKLKCRMEFAASSPLHKNILVDAWKNVFTGQVLLAITFDK